MFQVIQKMIVPKYQDSTPDKFFEHARRYQLFWTHQISTKKVPHFGCPAGSEFLDLWSSEMLRYEEIIFFKMIP